ncbi:MAG: GNAT family N-acetyltransferase [Clostridium sp.]|uniref:GNAT family N-acetyltransferase n=1 Tax=Clostridium sp. TaxID=1506 RepID=UPI003D6D534D
MKINEVEKKLLKHSEAKEIRIQELKDIAENKSICIQFIDRAIETINRNTPQYVQGYELKIANERTNPIEISEDKDKDNEYTFFTEKGENIKIDIVLKSKDKELIIGEIDCNVTWTEYSQKRYYVKLNYIALHEEYQNKGYGTEILNHIPTILSHLYKGEIAMVKTTAEVMKYDKYKIHEITYNERIKGIEAWLIKNEYQPNGSFLKDTELEIYEMNLRNNKSIDNDLLIFKRSLINILKSSLKDDFFISWRNESIEECEGTLEIICKNKYSDGVSEQKILKLQKIKETIKREYETLKQEKESIIFAVSEVAKLHDKVTLEELEINEDNSLDEKAIKLYCKYFNYGAVSKTLEQMGYTTKKKGTNENRKYTSEELKEIMFNSNTENKKLKEYANYIIISNYNCC